jgi:glycosyltransferase involved in cell wall biosynthesis
MDKKNIRKVSFISIVIPAYNNGRYLVRTIGSIFKQSYPTDKFEVIVVDDGSTDDTKECVERLQGSLSGSLRYFYQRNKGPSAARNLGIKNARGDIIVFTDSDCVVCESWLEEITGAYDNDRVAGVGGIIKPVPGNSIVSRYCAYVKMKNMPEMDKTGIVYLITANASFSKDCLDSVKGFDERYDFPGAEDRDLCCRLRKMGYYFNYNSRAVVFNSHKEDIKQLIVTYFNYGRGDSYLSLKIRSCQGLSGFERILNSFDMLFSPVFTVAKIIAAFSLRLIKLPFKSLIYYSQGLNIYVSLSYGSIDYLKDLSFALGCLVGQVTGKSRGF